MTQLFIAEQGSESMVQTHAYSTAISVCRIAWAGFAIVDITQAPINCISSVRASAHLRVFLSTPQPGRQAPAIASGSVI